MISDVQLRLVKARNELKAQKVYSGLAYSQLLLPENTPQQSYSGTASLSGSGKPLARLRFRFRRTDGLIDPPMINFAFTANYSPEYDDFVRSKGFTISGDDLGYFNWREVDGYIAELGDAYVDFYVDFSSSIRDDLFSVNSISFSVNCQAISNVNGTLEVERLV